jgi:hypothetical protein
MNVALRHVKIKAFAKMKLTLIHAFALWGSPEKLAKITTMNALQRLAPTMGLV